MKIDYNNYPFYIFKNDNRNSESNETNHKFKFIRDTIEYSIEKANSIPYSPKINKSKLKVHFNNSRFTGAYTKPSFMKIDRGFVDGLIPDKWGQLEVEKPLNKKLRYKARDYWRTEFSNVRDTSNSFPIRVKSHSMQSDERTTLIGRYRYSQEKQWIQGLPDDPVHLTQILCQLSSTDRRKHMLSLCYLAEGTLLAGPNAGRWILAHEVRHLQQPSDRRLDEKIRSGSLDIMAYGFVGTGIGIVASALVSTMTTVSSMINTLARNYFENCDWLEFEQPLNFLAKATLCFTAMAFSCIFVVGPTLLVTSTIFTSLFHKKPEDGAMRHNERDADHHATKKIAPEYRRTACMIFKGKTVYSLLDQIDEMDTSRSIDPQELLNAHHKKFAGSDHGSPVRRWQEVLHECREVDKEWMAT